MTWEVEIQLFGAFRQYAAGPVARVAVSSEATVADLRTAFAEQLGDDNARALLKASAFATDERVLDDSEALPTDSKLAVLPPVCGG